MKLLLEGSVPMLVGAFWMGGLGGPRQLLGDPPTAPPACTGVTYIYVCVASEGVDEGTAAGTGTKGAARCRPHLRPHIATSRKPGPD